MRPTAVSYIENREGRLSLFQSMLARSIYALSSPRSQYSPIQRQAARRSLLAPLSLITNS